MRRSKVQRPFYWEGHGEGQTGWYQWQSTGLVYLGQSLLNDETFARIQPVEVAA